MGILFIVLFIWTLATLPLLIFKRDTIIGIFVRANTPLIVLIAFERFFSTLDRKSPSTFMVAVMLVYAIASLREVFARKGLPIIEWALGYGAYLLLELVIEEKYLSYSLTSFVIFLLAYGDHIRKTEEHTA